MKFSWCIVLAVVFFIFGRVKLFDLRILLFESLLSLLSLAKIEMAREYIVFHVTGFVRHSLRHNAHTHTHVHAAAVSNGRVAPIVWLLCKVKVKPFLFRPFFWGYFLICREQCCVRCCASAAALFRPALHFSRSFDRPHIVWISFVQFKKITEKKGRAEMWRFEK